MDKANKLKTLRIKSEKELIKLLKENYQILTQTRFSYDFRKLKNVRSIRNTKKTIARIWTILKEKSQT